LTPSFSEDFINLLRAIALLGDAQAAGAEARCEKEPQRATACFPLRISTEPVLRYFCHAGMRGKYGICKEHRKVFTGIVTRIIPGAVIPLSMRVPTDDDFFGPGTTIHRVFFTVCYSKHI
jgi:hypothetical protein